MIKDIPATGCIIKFCNLRFENFGCVKQGAIQTESLATEKSRTLGVYGQNGSGKSTLVHVFAFLRLLLCGTGINDVSHYIRRGETTACLYADFEITIGERRKIFSYSVQIEISNNSIEWHIKQEKVVITDQNNQKNKMSLNYNPEDSLNIISPSSSKTRLSNFIEKNTNLTKGIPSLLFFLMQKEYCHFYKSSYLFGENMLSVYNSYCAENEESIFDYIVLMNDYANHYFFVINDSFINETVASNNKIPVIFFNQQPSQRGALNYIGLNLNGPTFFKEENEGIFSAFIDKINKLLTATCPGTILVAHQRHITPTNLEKEGAYYDIYTKKASVEIPLKYESLGIKKIISIINIMVMAYINPSILLVIDEFDSSLNEMILDTYLNLLKKHGEGELIFTANNLYPLELLDKSQCYFTTTNSDNRYTHLKYVKPNNNLRSLYMNLIKQGGDEKNSELFIPISEEKMKEIFDSCSKEQS